MSMKVVFQTMSLMLCLFNLLTFKKNSFNESYFLYKFMYYIYNYTNGSIF